MNARAPTAGQLQALLEAELGRSVRVLNLERLAPWSVLRCRLDGGPGAPASVIVKWLREEGVRTDPRQVATERAALEFLAQIGFDAVPRLIAADQPAGVLVLEDLAPRTPLADQLRQLGPQALGEQRLAFASAIGALNAASAGKAGVYAAIGDRYGALEALPERDAGRGWVVVLRRLEALGLTLSAAAEDDLAAAAETLQAPGAFLALSNGDPEPNNFLVDGADGRLIDFEFASWRHALTCARWIHVPGPAWITASDPICGALEDAYRRALARGIAEAEDDRLFGLGMTSACLAYAIERLDRFAILDARSPGEPSRVQMVSTLEAAASAARRHRALPHLAGWADAAAQWLRRRWPDTDVDLGGYPPYAPR